MIIAETEGHLDPNYDYAGFYAFGVIISIVASIPLKLVITLPIQAISVILLTIVLMTFLFHEQKRILVLILSIMIIFITKFGYTSYFQYFCHQLGFILSLNIIVLTYLYLQTTRQDTKTALALIMLITISSQNFISYKMTYFSIIFLIIIQIGEWLLCYRNNKKMLINKDLLLITLFSVVFTSAFGKVFQLSIVPRLEGEIAASSSGLEKMANYFEKSSVDPLNVYTFNYSLDMRNALTIWVGITLLATGIMSMILLYKFFRKCDFTNAEKVYVGLVGASAGLLVFYTVLGLADIGTLLYCGLISLGMIFNLNANKTRHIYNLNDRKDFYSAVGNIYNIENIKHKLKIFSIISIIILILLNGFFTFRSYEEQYQGLRDWNQWEYIQYPSEWLGKNIDDSNPIQMPSVYTDVFSGGVIAFNVIRSQINNVYYPRVFSDPQMSLLLLSDKVTQTIPGSIFIINSKLFSFSAQNWEIYNSWPNYKDILMANQDLNKIFSSGPIEFYIYG